MLVYLLQWACGNAWCGPPEQGGCREGWKEKWRDAGASTAAGGLRDSGDGKDALRPMGWVGLGTKCGLL